MSRLARGARIGIRGAGSKAAIALAAVWLAGCGYYGPPVRSAQAGSTKAAAVNEADAATASPEKREEERERKRADQEPTP